MLELPDSSVVFETPTLLASIPVTRLVEVDQIWSHFVPYLQKSTFLINDDLSPELSVRVAENERCCVVGCSELRGLQVGTKGF